jgi:hypothetical protein
MSVRKTGNFGQLVLPVGDGTTSTNVALTKSASKTINGTTYTDRFFGHAMTHWNPAKPMSVSLQGILGSVDITPTASNNEVSTSAFQYKKDNSGVQTAAADASVTVVRPGSGKVNWNLIIADLATGAITAVQGTDGDAHVDTFDAAGGPPLVAVDKIIVGAVKFTSSTAGVVLPSEITISLSTGALIQERADLPAQEIIPLDGGVLLSEALPACHTGPLPRKAYATFTSQKNFLATVGHTTKWTFSGTRPVVSLPAQNDISASKAPSGPMDTKGTFARFATDADMFKLAYHKGQGYVKMYPDKNETGYFEAAVVITSFGQGAEMGAGSMTDLSFDVNGNIEWRDA